MNTAEKDPDTLQILDELESEWVRQWRKATNKKTVNPHEMTLIVVKQEKIPSITHLKKHKI
jgi:hypothetical protein